MIDRAESLCRRIGIDPARPLVVVHTREHGYHKLGVQRFRNTNVRNYVPALRRLIARYPTPGEKIPPDPDARLNPVLREEERT